MRLGRLVRQLQRRRGAGALGGDIGCSPTARVAVRRRRGRRDRCASQVRIDEARSAAGIGYRGDRRLDRASAGGHVNRDGLPTRAVDRPRDPADRGRCGGERDRAEVRQLQNALVRRGGLDDPFGRRALRAGCALVSLNVCFVVVSSIVNWNCPVVVEYTTDAVMLLPGETLMFVIVTEPSGYISYHTLYSARPPTTSCSVPICSTVDGLYPSIPTHTALYAVPLPVTVGTVQLPETAVTEFDCGEFRLVSTA